MKYQYTDDQYVEINIANHKGNYYIDPRHNYFID